MLKVKTILPNDAGINTTTYYNVIRDFDAFLRHHFSVVLGHKGEIPTKADITVRDYNTVKKDILDSSKWPDYGTSCVQISLEAPRK